MTLSKILDGVPVIKMFQTMYGRMVVTHEVDVRGIQYDSRKVCRSELFVAMRGSVSDGHKFIEKAVANGASVVVVEDDAALPDSFFMHAGVVKVVVRDSRQALALMSANFFEHPSEKLRLIGVTGTNGKTSTTFLIKSILEANGEKVGLIGTIEYRIGNEMISATHTTPESLELNELLSTMAGKGCTSVVMEVSSHALAQHRVHGLKFAAATFTNLSHEHLDFHHSMDEYFRAKKMLFDGLTANAVAVTNLDDARGLQIIADTNAKTLTFGIGRGDVSASDCELTMASTSFSASFSGGVNKVTSTLIGRFNVQNILAAYATAVALGLEPVRTVDGIANVKSVRGRFEQIASPNGWVAIVDYAHTPDGLENCLRAIHDSLPKVDDSLRDRRSTRRERRGRIICVFGAGGNRDKLKRPLMGRVASELSDITVITSDNPRREKPEDIVKDIQAGVLLTATVIVEIDRRKAIHRALAMAKAGDVVLIAGKGHEDYQVLGEKKVHFDDREEVENFIRNAV